MRIIDWVADVCSSDLWLRDSLRSSSVPELAQLALGLAIPLLLMNHVIGTRYAHAAFGVVDDYRYVLLNLWVFPGGQPLRHPVALLVAWGHGCIGLYLWLRFRPWFDRAAPWLLAAAGTVPRSEERRVGEECIGPGR